MTKPQTKITLDIIDQINNPEIELFYECWVSEEARNAALAEFFNPFNNRPCYSLKEAIENAPSLGDSLACLEVVYGKNNTTLYHKDEQGIEEYDQDGIAQYFKDLKAIKAKKNLKK